MIVVLPTRVRSTYGDDNITSTYVVSIRRIPTVLPRDPFFVEVQLTSRPTQFVACLMLLIALLQLRRTVLYKYQKPKPLHLSTLSLYQVVSLCLGYPFFLLVPYTFICHHEVPCRSCCSIEYFVCFRLAGTLFYVVWNE